MIGEKWVRADGADHEYIESAGPGLIACKCGEWSSKTPMPLTLAEWNLHRTYVLTPTRTNVGILVMLANGVAALLFLLVSLSEFFTANRLAAERDWAHANFFLMVMALTFVAARHFYFRYVTERDDL